MILPYENTPRAELLKVGKTDKFYVKPDSSTTLGYAVWQVQDGGDRKLESSEVITLATVYNIDQGTAWKACKDIFLLYNLNTCFVNYCKSLFKNKMLKCASKDDLDSFSRDYIWMAIHVIKYYL